MTVVKYHMIVTCSMYLQVAHQMCWAARQVLERQLAGVAVEEEVTQETAATARGNGSGIM